MERVGVAACANLPALLNKLSADSNLRGLADSPCVGGHTQPFQPNSLKVEPVSLVHGLFQLRPEPGQVDREPGQEPGGRARCEPDLSRQSEPGCIPCIPAQDSLPTRSLAAIVV